MNQTTIVDALVAARLSGEKLAAYPGPVPASMAEAFAIQSAVRGKLGWRHAGWKIGCTSEKSQKAFRTAEPVAGPVYAERFYRSDDLVATNPSNTRLAEPEIAFTMAHDLAPRPAAYTVDDVLAAVATVHAAIEIVNPRLPGGFADAIEWIVADGGINHALVLAEGVAPLPRQAYARIAVNVKVNGNAKSSGVGANALGGPEHALTWLANDLLAKGLYLRAGEVVTTGVLTDLFMVDQGDVVEADYDLLGSIKVRL